MKLFLIILLATSCISFTSSDTLKMVIIFGEPKNSPTFTVLNMDFATCVDYCYETDECMGVYNENVDVGECHVFENGKLSEVEEVDRSVGSNVAFKINATVTSQCPLTPAQSYVGGFGYSSYTVTLTNGIWKFTPYPACPENFTMFTRPKGKWCIGVFPTPQFINQPDATSQCANLYNGVLTGLENIDEYQFIIDTVTPLLPQIKAKAPSFKELGFWINGYRKPTCQVTTWMNNDCNGTNEFDFSDPLLSANPTGYIWGVGQPSGKKTADGSNCVQFPFNSATRKTNNVDDYLCNGTTSVYKTTAFVGYVCGVEAS